MKKILSLLLFAGFVFGANAQEKILNVQETTEGIGVHPCGDRHEALVQFVTSEPFGLEFESTHDNELDVTVDSVAGKKTYSIVFVTQAPGQDYSGRRLIIKAVGFQNYRLPLPLQDKQKFEYTVSDPYSKLRSPFFQYFERAQEDFREGNYQTAKDNYELCRYCPEFVNDSTNILNHILICDSMMQWNNDAMQAENFHQFKKAAEFYGKMLRYNSNDFIRQQLMNTQTNFMQDCQALANMGQTYFDQDNFERAQQMYEQIVENGCNEYSREASSMLSTIRKAKMRRDDHARTLMVAWSPNMFGLSWGNYYRSRANGWYGTFMFNVPLIEMLSKKSYPKGEVREISQDEYIMDYEDMTKNDKTDNYYPSDNKLKYEAMFAIGSSWHIWEPIFVHFGVGYHGGGYDTFNGSKFQSALKDNEFKDFNLLNQEKWSDKFRNKASEINWYNGVAPELGIVLKYWRAAIKVTYQYTFWLDTENKDFLNKNTSKVQLGVGFCW